MMNKQDLKDRLWSAASGAVTAVAVAIVSGVAVVAGAFVSGVVSGVAVAGVFVGVVVAGGVAGVVVSEKTDKFRPAYAAGGLVLSLAAIFGVANHYKWLDKPPETAPVKQRDSIESPAISASECGDIAVTFNENNDNNNVKASINDNGQCVLTVAPIVPGRSMHMS